VTAACINNPCPSSISNTVSPRTGHVLRVCSVPGAVQGNYVQVRAAYAAFTVTVQDKPELVLTVIAGYAGHLMQRFKI
jgi:hypothetical protein